MPAHAATRLWRAPARCQPARAPPPRNWRRAVVFLSARGPCPRGREREAPRGRRAGLGARRAAEGRARRRNCFRLRACPQLVLGRAFKALCRESGRSSILPGARATRSFFGRGARRGRQRDVEPAPASARHLRSGQTRRCRGASCAVSPRTAPAAGCANGPPAVGRLGGPPRPQTHGPWAAGATSRRQRASPRRPPPTRHPRAALSAAHGTLRHHPPGRRAAPPAGNRRRPAYRLPPRVKAGSPRASPRRRISPPSGTPHDSFVVPCTLPAPPPPPHRPWAAPRQPQPRPSETLLLLERRPATMSARVRPDASVPLVVSSACGPPGPARRVPPAPPFRRRSPC
jgi:hypothetical protein